MIRALVSIAVFAGAASAAEAKDWTSGAFKCRDERIVSFRQPQKPVSPLEKAEAGDAPQPDNVGWCLNKCTAKAGCVAFGIVHTVNAALKVGKNECTLWGTKAFSQAIYKSIKGKQWAAVCVKN